MFKQYLGYIFSSWAGCKEDNKTVYAITVPSLFGDQRIRISDMMLTKIVVD